MRRLSIILLFTFCAAALYGYDGGVWRTAARLVVSPNEYYALEKNDNGDYRLFSGAPETTLFLGKGKKTAGRVSFAAPGQPSIILFLDRKDPEITRRMPSPVLLPFIDGCTFRAPAGVEPLDARVTYVVAGSPDDDHILLEEAHSGTSPPPFKDSPNYLYVEASGGLYKRFPVAIVPDKEFLVYAGKWKSETASLKIIWDEQGRAVGKVILPDTSEEFIECGYFDTTIDQPYEEPEEVE